MAIQHTITDEGSHVLIVSTGYQPSRQRINKQTHDLKKMKDGQGVEFLRISSGPTTILDIYHAEVASPVTGNIAALEVVIGPYFFNVGGGGFAFYTEINISSSQILNNFATGGNSGGFELLPAIAGCYYDFVADWEYTRGTVSYSTAASAIQFNYYNAGLNTSTSLAVISGLNLSFSGNRCCPNIRPQMQSTAFNSFNIGDSLCIKLANNINPTLGDGTVKIKLRYNIITFS